MYDSACVLMRDLMLKLEFQDRDTTLMIKLPEKVCFGHFEVVERGNSGCSGQILNRTGAVCSS